MTTETMPDADINVQVATWCEEKPGADYFQADVIKHQISEHGFWAVGWAEPLDEGSLEAVWLPAHDFATDLNACALFEALVEERGKWEQYVDDMLFVLGLRHEPGSVPITPFEAWALYRSPAQARCKALVAMAGGDDES